MGMYGRLMQITPQRLSDFTKNPRLAYDEALPQLASTEGGYESYPLEAESAEFQEELSTHQKTPQEFDIEAYRKAALDAMKRQNSRSPKPFPEAKLEESINRIVAAMYARREQWQGTAREVRAKLAAKINPDLFSLEKDWHMLHYALNGTAEGGNGPLADAILGGSELRSHDGREDYGPIRYLTPQQVKQTAAELVKVDAKKLLDKLDANEAKSRQIYLAETLDDLESWSYFPELFEKFRGFYAEAAKKGNAMLLKIV